MSIGFYFFLNFFLINLKIEEKQGLSLFFILFKTGTDLNFKSKKKGTDLALFVKCTRAMEQRKAATGLSEAREAADR